MDYKAPYVVDLRKFYLLRSIGWVKCAPHAYSHGSLDPLDNYPAVTTVYLVAFWVEMLW